MSILVIFSLIVKCFGAGLEIGSQALISQLWGVKEYGEYAFFISLADGFYALFFSGIIKFNNYYIPQGNDVSIFKKKYYLKYVLPICVLGLSVSIIFYNIQAICAILSGFCYLCAMDTSSKMMSHGHYKTALIGEYCIGRLFVILAVLAFSVTNNHIIITLYIIYGSQFIVALLYYVYVNKRRKLPVLKGTLEKEAAHKYVVFQSTEIAHTIVMQTSVIVQYIFGGAYQTALISIVLVVRKLVNFITGPTSKLYQPEFSKRFLTGDKKGLSIVYAQITRIQLCFMMPVFTLLISRPDLILKVFNSELVEYGWLVRVTSVVFLTMIAFGPLSNFLPMTGQEKIDTVANWTSVGVMYLTMALSHNNQYFVVIGFCAQILYITGFKLILFYRYLRTTPMPITDYLKIFFIWLVCSFIINNLPDLTIITIAIIVIHFCANFIFVFPKDELKVLLNRIKHK